MAKTPHNKADFDKMDEADQKKLDRDVFNFDTEEFDVNKTLLQLNLNLNSIFPILGRLGPVGLGRRRN